MIQNTKFKNLDLHSEKMVMMPRRAHQIANWPGQQPTWVPTRWKWAPTWRHPAMLEMDLGRLPSPPTKCMAFLMRAFKNVRQQLYIKEEMFLHSARSCSIFLATQVFLRAIEADMHTQGWAITITWSKVVQPRNVQDQFKVSLRMVSPSSTTNMLFNRVLAE